MQFGGTALFWAARDGYVNIVQMMVDHGATVDLGRHNDWVTMIILNWWVGFGVCVVTLLSLFLSIYTCSVTALYIVHALV